jgi:hypothetical protein
MRQRMGPCLHCQCGKQTQDHQNSITIDDTYPTLDNEDILFADIFYLKGSPTKEPYMLTVLAKTKHITVTYLDTKTSKNIIAAFGHILDFYKINKWNISKIITDHEANFSASIQQMSKLGVQVIQNSPEQHSRAAERAIRTIEELSRTTYLALPYTLPPMLYRNLITFVTERYNILPQVDGDHRSPRERITGQRPIYNKDVKATFGEVVICIVTSHQQQHDLGERGEIGLVIGNPFNKNGVCAIYIPTRRSVCYRTEYTKASIDDSIKQLISTLPQHYSWRQHFP